MVFSGPSLGCFRCRERHTKCDLARPACQKCLANGQVCPGYRDVSGFIFKDVTEDVAVKQRRRAGRARRSNMRTTSRSSSTELIMRPPSPCPAVPLDFNATSVDYFINRFIIPSEFQTKWSRGHFDYLPQLLSSARSSSPLAAAVTAMASKAVCLSFGRRTDAPLIIRNELRAVKAVNRAIADPVECVQDETLLAVLCLDVSWRFSKDCRDIIPSSSHANGALSLVRHRGVQSFKSDVSRSLLRATQSNTILTILRLQDKKSQEAILLLPVIEDVERGSATAMQQLLLRTLQTERRLVNLAVAKNAPDAEQTLTMIMAELRSILNSLSQWAEYFKATGRETFPQAQSFADLAAGRDEHGLSLSLHAMFTYGQWCGIKFTTLRLTYMAILEKSKRGLHDGVPLNSTLLEAQSTVDEMISVIKSLTTSTDNVEGYSDPIENALAHTTGLISSLDTPEKRTVALSTRYRAYLVRWAQMVLNIDMHFTPGFGVSKASQDFLDNEWSTILADRDCHSPPRFSGSG